MKWFLIVLISLPSGDRLSIVPQVAFYSQTDCLIASKDLSLYVAKDFPDYFMTCISMPEERDD